MLVEPDNPPSGRFAAFRPYSTFSMATPGQTFHVTAEFHAPPNAGVDLVGLEILAPEGWEVESAGRHRFRVKVPNTATPTSAHWNRASVWDAAYRIRNDRWFGLPLPPAPLTGRATYRVAGIDVQAEQPALTSFIDSTGVQRRRTLVAGPAVSVSIPSEVGVLPIGLCRYRFTVAVRNNTSRAIEGEFRLELSPGWRSTPDHAPFSFRQEGETREILFDLTVPTGLPPGDYPVKAVASYDGIESRSSFERVTYPGLAAAYLSRPARHTVRVIDVKTAPRLKVGYVSGTGDDVPATIRQLGAAVELLDADALAAGDLSAFDTIVLGIRAYAARQDLKTHNQRLLDYVAQGGVLVVQYNAPEFDHDYGPYPYKMTRRPEEVSEEDSPVEILAPDDPVFNFPNRITKRDFDGWVEQRGSKFLAEWDPRYRALLSTHDQGQPPQKGGWLVARHGKGLYVYCAYAWYRQLPYAVPGAVRLFANLISLGAPDAPWR